MEPHVAANSKHRITSDAMALVDCQGHLMSGSSGSNSQSSKYLSNVGMSQGTPWIHQGQHDLGESYLT